ncbi:MAG: alkaline phosphatase D family protein [Polyangiales bacterium]
MSLPRRAAAVSPKDRPLVPQGLQIGDVLADRALIWARADRPSRMYVEWSLDESMRGAQRVRGPYALEDSDFTARLDVTGLPPDQRVFVRVTFESLASGGAVSEPVVGRLRTAPSARRNVRFLWSGDTVGQGYGINPDLGGMRIYESMRARQPDFFIHAGDTIYADSPVAAELPIDQGRIWRNLVTVEKSKVAETLAEFRGHHRYNFLDGNLRRFNAEVPQIWQWDDHEVFNNYSDGADLSADARYTEKNVRLLAARGQRAFLEYAPLRAAGAEERERVYRRIPYGPLLDVFVLDMRSYRAPNSWNRQPTASDATTFLGSAQLRWLQQGLRESRAVWKVIAADMPIGLMVRDGKDATNRDRFDAAANGDGPALGRELELAELLRFAKQQKIKNLVWLCADVHYTAAHYFDPNKAKFPDFDPFWEFVSGPLNAGTFGPNDPDGTFGMQVVYQRAAPFMNASPLAGHQFFGEVEISGQDDTLTVTLRDLTGAALFTQRLQPRT